MILNLPNILTLIRIIVIPLVVVFMYIPGKVWDLLALSVFIFACITDYLDGFLARIWNQHSSFGKFLDPIADKLLVSSVILVLTALDIINGFHLLPALVILCREVLVSGLREFLADLKEVVPVSRLAKWKTTIQMLSLGFLLLGNKLFHFSFYYIGLILLWIAASLTIMTGYDYLKASFKHFKKTDS